MKDPDIIYTNHSTTELQTLSVEFARHVRRLFHHLLRSSRSEHNAIDQMYRSGTSVGANIREAKYAQSPKDFLHKLKIAEKEMAEFLYWLGLLCDDPSSIDESDSQQLAREAESIRRLLASTIVSIKRKHGL